MKTFRLSLLFFLFTLTVIAPMVAFAADCELPSGEPKPIRVSVYIPGLTDGERGCYYIKGGLPEYIAGIYNYGVRIAGFVAFVMVMIGGAQWLVAGGNPEKITGAKTRIMNAIVGLILVFFSYFILNTINPALVKPTLFVTPIKALKQGVIAGLQNEMMQTVLEGYEENSEKNWDSDGPKDVNNTMRDLFGLRDNYNNLINQLNKEKNALADKDLKTPFTPEEKKHYDDVSAKLQDLRNNKTTFTQRIDQYKKDICTSKRGTLEMRNTIQQRTIFDGISSGDAMRVLCDTPDALTSYNRKDYPYLFR